MNSEDSDDAPIVRRSRNAGNATEQAWEALESQEQTKSQRDEKVVQKPKKRQPAPKASRAGTRKGRMSDDDDDDDDDDSDSAPLAPPIKGKLKAAVEKTITSRKVKRQLDNDDDSPKSARLKEGQKHLCAPMGDGTRAFYETLLNERPNSVLANKYCIEHGILIGTKLKEQLARYYELRDMSAFKGAVGGIKPGLSHILLCKELEPIETTKSKGGKKVIKTGCKKESK